MKRSPLPRRTPLARSGRLQSRVRRLGTPPIWRLDLGPCAVCAAEGGVCSGPVQGHHVIAKQALKKRGLGTHLWDRRNRLAVCERRHQQHENASRRIPRDVLPAAAFAFAHELELMHVLDRVYPSEGDTA